MVEVVMVEASARHSAETCSAGRGSKPHRTKPASWAAHGHITMEAAAAVETAAMSAATRGSIHRHRRKADCRHGSRADQHFPEHGTHSSRRCAANIQDPIRSG